MLWLVLAVLSAFFAALVPILAKIGLAEVDSSVATATRAIVMMLFTVVFVLPLEKEVNWVSLPARIWVS